MNPQYSRELWLAPRLQEDPQPQLQALTDEELAACFGGGVGGDVGEIGKGSGDAIRTMP